MFKSYVLSIVGMLLGVGALVFIYIYRDKLEPENAKYNCVFNSATLESKIIGLKLDDVSEKYLAPASVKTVKKKGGKKDILAHYEDVKIFTRGEKTVVREMDVTYQDSVATAITLGEPHATKDASIANFSPLAFTLIDAEIFTRSKETVNTEKAQKWQAVLLILWLIVMANLPFFLTWPLATWAAKKLDTPWGALLMIPLWLVLYWIYFGIASYAIGTAMLFVVLGIIWLLIAMRAFSKATHPVPEPTFSPTYQSGRSNTASRNTINPTRRQQDYYCHIQNLAMISAAASFAKNESETRYQFIVDIAMREELELERFKQAINSPTIKACQPSNPALRQEFIDNIAKILLCDTTFSTIQLGIAKTLTMGLGVSDDDFHDLVKRIASNVYHRELSSYNILEVEIKED